MQVFPEDTRAIIKVGLFIISYIIPATNNLRLTTKRQFRAGLPGHLYFLSPAIAAKPNCQTDRGGGTVFDESGDPERFFT